MLTTLLFLFTVLVVGMVLMLGIWFTGRRAGEPLLVTRRWIVASAAALALWLATTGLLAAGGRLSDWTAWPPR